MQRWVVLAYTASRVSPTPARIRERNAYGHPANGDAISGATSSAAVAAAATSLTNVQSMYGTLPHASLSADLATLASRMVSSGQFKTAVVSAGGISATLPNGSPALVFVDHVGDTSNAIASAVAAGGFTSEQYGVDTGDVELSTMDGLGNGGYVDVLDLSTHGMVGLDAAGQNYYAWLSDSDLTGATLAKYAADYAAGNLIYAVTLAEGDRVPGRGV